MREVIKNESRLRYRLALPDGGEVAAYRLYMENGLRLGDVMLEYNAARGHLTMACVTGYGNYAYRWQACGDKGYARFLLEASNEYITDKMAMGHDEDRVLDDGATCAAVRRVIARRDGDDPDWLGEALGDLESCECEADFYAWAQRYDFEYVYECFEYGWGGCLNGFCNTLLPELKRVLREELNAEC